MDTSTLPPPPSSSPPPAGPPAGPSRPAGPPTGGRRPVSHRARTGWRVAASLMAALAVVWGATQVVSQLAHEERTEVATYDSAGLTSLDVAVDSGSLTVVGTDSDTITVTARISDGLRPTTVRQEIVDDRLELRGGCFAILTSFCNVAFTVELPETMSVRARLGNDDIRLTNVRGDVDAHTENGIVRVQGADGARLVLASDNGDVVADGLRSPVVDADSDNGDVDLSFVEAPTAVEATSDNGDVDVAVPDDGTAYAVTTSSGNGSSAAPIRTDPSSDRSITAKSGNGDVQVVYLTR
jgi:hypothetical protein